MTKISVILPTNKLNNEKELDKFEDLFIQIVLNSKEKPLSDVFTRLSLSHLDSLSHILNPTIGCVENQRFDDYEVILCHRYPEDLNHYKNPYTKVKIVKEKESIWHKLGDQYRTVNNIRNTGLIHAKGELILFLDDYTIFDENLLQNVWDAYQSGYYITARGMRRIRYNPEAKPVSSPTRKYIVDNGICSSYNFNNISYGDLIPKSSTWTYCCSVSLEDCLKVNGFDEIYDGNFGGTDQDFGRRLEKVSSYKRKLVGDIYEFAHKSPRQKIRDDEKLRHVCGQFPIPKHIRANSWKPTKYDMKRYKFWHKQYMGELDQNWNKFMDVPLYNIEDLRK